jgi:HEPN domain-containing protein
MKDETRQWLKYAAENLESAKVLKESRLFNPCLQNIQQSVEKSLKSILIESSLKLKRTHSIAELRNILRDNSIRVGLDDEECEFLDSIYLPSKYPLGSALPEFEPDNELCESGIDIAEKVYAEIKGYLEKHLD